MTTTETDPVAEAQREAAEAEELARTLEDKIRDGDESVTPEQLSHAEGLGRFARLRVEAAEKRAAAARKEAALERASALVDELHDGAEADAEFVQAWTDAVAAYKRFAQVLERRNAGIAELADEAAGVDTVLRRDAGVGIDSLGVKGAMFGGDVGYQVPAAGINVAAADRGLTLASVPHSALTNSQLSAFIPRAGSVESDLAASTLAAKVAGWPAAIAAVKDV